MAFVQADRVKETSTTTGTGTYDLAGAATGFQTFVAGIGTTNTCHYTATDGTNWEVGIGTVTDAATDTLARTTILASSNAGAAVNWAAGTRTIFCTLPGAVMNGSNANAIIREKLTANRTYYVRTDGSDSNTGLADSAGGAFLTYDAAYELVANDLDFAGYTVTIQAGGSGVRTFTGQILVDKGWTGGGQLKFVGDTTNMNVVISTTSADCFKTTGALPGAVTIEGFDLRTTTSGNGINHFAIGVLYIGKMIYGACAGNAHIQIYGIGRYAEITSAYTINGNANRHIFVASLSYLYVGGVVVTITGALTFASRFVDAAGHAIIEGQNTWNIGTSVAGVRYSVSNGASIDTYGAGISHFPGGTAGVVSDGGRYDALQVAFAGDVVIGTSGPGTRRLHVYESNGTTNAVTQLQRLQVVSTGTPANGIGVGQEFVVETAADNHEIGAILEVYTKDVTAASEDFGVRWKTMTAGAAAATAIDFSLPGTVYPQGHIFGLTMSNSGVNDVVIAVGEAVDETGVWNMTLAASITKQLPSSWAVGTAAGGLNTGAEANSTWYEVILIGREDTRVVDVMFSTTANRATLPADYTHKRRIGWIRNDSGSTILPFTQIDDYFTLTTQINDVAQAITATAAAATVTVPPSAIGRFRGGLNVTAVNTGLEVAVVFSEIVEGNVTPTATTAIAQLAGSGTNATAATNDDFDASQFELRVSSTSTIEYDCAIGTGGTGNFDLSTFGWIDHRRKWSAT